MLPLPSQIPLRPVLMGSALLGSGLLLGDLLHSSLGSAGLLAAGAAGLWWLGSNRTAPSDRLPQSPLALLDHCRGLLAQFDALQLPLSGREQELEHLVALGQRQERHVLLAGAAADPATIEKVQSHFRGAAALQLHLARSLPLAPREWLWPQELLESDQLIYLLQGAPSAADLRWLQATPEDLPLLVLAQAEASTEQLESWRLQLGSRFTLVRCDQPLPVEVVPLSHQRQITQLRSLRQLHGRWQVELEAERRLRLQPLVLRSQWLVAAGVFASPVPSVDLLLLTVVNGLLLKEMAELWQCSWTSEQLQAAATELGRTALGLGALEWGSQALAGVLKLHGATWVVGGAMQALAAAYFTRVVARAMADYLALAAGVPSAELPALKHKLPLLVATAVEQERLDWPAFAEQARDWITQQNSTSSTPA
ncbi:MAG: YcjF family protein [Synechococcus sp.]|nr:YcjF family protein [Synechococcus sp.]